MNELIDPYSRRLSYLRLSVTEACNFRCRYCLPYGHTKKDSPYGTLSPEEIYRLALAFSELGVTKIRITGGEPTLRKDLFRIIKELSIIDGIKEVGLTTNGFNLPKIAPRLLESGVTNLNVSLDSLRAETFRQITGKDKFNDVYKGVLKALEVGFKRVKINSVLLRDINTNEIEDFIELTKSIPITVRFIELMEPLEIPDLYQKRHFPVLTVETLLKGYGWRETEKQINGGPEKTFIHPEYKGKIGIIAPYSKNFCLSCNRIRVTSRGELILCLFGKEGYPLKPLLQTDNQKDLLKAKVRSFILKKAFSHESYIGEQRRDASLSVIGG